MTDTPPLNCPIAWTARQLLPPPREESNSRNCEVPDTPLYRMDIKKWDFNLFKEAT